MNFRIAPGPQLLRTQVYEFLRNELKEGNLKPGSFIRMNQIMKKLDFSRTPLRDAFLQLQSEGFVTFLPQRGIRINELSQQDILNIYELIGALDSRGMLSVFDKLGAPEIERMTSLNEEMGKNLTKESFSVYWDLNTDFHNVYLDFSPNEPLLYQISILRQRLFEFGKKDWNPKMKTFNYEEHIEMMELIKKRFSVSYAIRCRGIPGVGKINLRNFRKPAPKRTYKPNPKHKPKKVGNIGAEPSNPVSALDNSVPKKTAANGHDAGLLSFPAHIASHTPNFIEDSSFSRRPCRLHPKSSSQAPAARKHPPQ